MRLILLISHSRQSSLEYPDARSGADDDTRGKADAETALDHARDCGKPPLEARRVADFSERAVRDVVAAVGPVRLIARYPQCRPCAEFREPVECHLPAEGHDLDRDRRALAEPLDQL